MLETSNERIKMLKAGFTGKQIERMYLEENNFKIEKCPLLFEIVVIGSKQNRKTCEIAAGSVYSLGLAVASVFDTSGFRRSILNIL
ncbi:MAG: hypothetical protein OIN87_10395 [Candidatus Methanoperedens sp.]|nr:hypothetical protein [Candidatus Methanoperedens sp.]